MKITVAIDSFKGSLSTFQASSAIAAGIKKVYKDAEVFTCPIADGGEGTVEAIISANNGEMVTIPVHNPLDKIINASYGIIPQRKTAVIEMSAAAGITLVSKDELNPLNATTYGVGELIADAIERGCRKFIIGIGGSATNDGGVGMLQALGFKFTDKNGKDICRSAKGLEDLAEISSENALAELSQCEFCVACDVKNPLCGKDGCSSIYGPQKCATPDMIKSMDKWLENYAKLTKDVIPQSDCNFPGTGAAGGMGFALMAYLGAKLTSGIELVMRETGLEEYIKKSDMVITGEGRLDGQTSMGKVPVGVAGIAKKYKLPVVAFAGCVTSDATECNNNGIDAFFPILKAPCSLTEAMDMENAYQNLKDMTVQVFNLIKSIG